MKEIGIIKWFDEDKHYGIIVTPKEIIKTINLEGSSSIISSNKCFLHINNWKDKESIKPYSIIPVLFESKYERNKIIAKNSFYFKNSKNCWDTLFSILGNCEDVVIKDKRKRRRYNLIKISMLALTNEFDENILYNSLNNKLKPLSDKTLIEDCKTLIEVKKQTKNDRLKNTLNKVFLENFFRLNFDHRIEFWRKSILEFDMLTKKEIFENSDKFTINDLKRILEHEGGDNICCEIVSKKIKEISNQTPSNIIIATYKFLEFVKDYSKKNKLLNDLNEILFKNSLNEINVRLNELPPISDKTILSQYNNLKQSIPTEISKNQDVELSKIISEAIINKSTEQVKTDLWLSGDIDEIENTQIVELLCNGEIQISDKLKALKKIYNSDQIILIIEQLLDKQKPEKIFELIERFVKHENELDYYFQLKSAIKSGDFGDDKIGYSLLMIFQSIITKKTTKEEKANLFFEGWLNNYPADYILYSTQNLTEEELRKILNNNNTTEDYRFKLLENKRKNITKDDTIWFLKLSQEFLPDEYFRKIDNQTVNQISDEIWLELWENKATKILRKEYLLDYLDDDQSKYTKIHNWINDDLISTEKISGFLYEKLEEKKDITDRIEFYTAFNIIKELFELDTKWADDIMSLKNNFYNLLLWHLGLKDDFDFTTLKGKFIYFKPDDQVYIFKRLFYLKHTNKIDFTIEELDEIVRADTDLYLTNEKFKNDFVLDISTHILIEAIKSYQTKNNFLFESDLILRDLKNNSSKKFKIENYFEECPGRLVADWNWRTNGTIKKQIVNSNGKRYEFFRIEFEYSPSIVESIKKISIRKYNPDEQFWGVPLKCKNEVLEFAKKHKFFIDLGNKKHYDNNTHLVEYSRDERPIGIRFCEGRKSNKKHNKLNCEFWWCTNQPCFQFAEVDHLSDKFSIPKYEGNYFSLNKKKSEEKKIWEYYKLIDILRILNINTDEQKKAPNDFIPDGHYYNFISHINAFNRLMDKLYCKKCEELLYPTEAGHFSLYRVNKFHCKKNNCSEHKKTIYLNHCLNGECSNIIDSRISKTCNNGLYICDNCGSCCSDSMFKKRLGNLKLVGGYIHPELKKNVQEENGHLEKAEYYCFKCNGMMSEKTDKKYDCESCNVSYDLEQFKWLDKKWTKKNQRRSDHP